MSGRARLGRTACAAWIAGCAAALAAPGGAPAAPVLELRPHERVLDVALIDLDGDGTVDPVVASARETGPRSAERFLSVYRIERAAGAAQPESDLVWQRQVPDDVIAFALGDVLGTGARTPLYFTSQSVFALDAGGRPRPVVRGHRFFFSRASRDALPFWDASSDLDGDSRDDLVVADPTGYAIYRQSAENALVPAGRIEVGSSFAGEPQGRQGRIARREGPIVLGRRLRRVASADANADQRMDLIAMKQDFVLVFPQQGDGRFEETPAIRHRLVSPDGAPFGGANAAPPPAIAHGDVNADGRVDFVVPELDLSDLVTRLRIFLAGENGLPERPSQILKLSSLGAEPELVDLDGDGWLDLGCATFRSDRLLSLGGGGQIETLDFTYYGFLFRPDTGLFSTRPDLRYDASWNVPDDPRPADEREEETEDDAGFIRFLGDFDGDGVRDAALFTAEGDFSVRTTRLDGDALSVDASPLIETRVPPTSRVRFADVNGDGKSDAVFLYRDAVRVVVSP